MDKETLSLLVSILIDTFSVISYDVSNICLLISIPIASFPSFGPMSSAIASPVIGLLYLRIDLSGKVISIFICFNISECYKLLFSSSKNI